MGGRGSQDLAEDQGNKSRNSEFLEAASGGEKEENEQENGFARSSNEQGTDEVDKAEERRDQRDGENAADAQTLRQ